MKFEGLAAGTGRITGASTGCERWTGSRGIVDGDALGLELGAFDGLAVGDVEGDAMGETLGKLAQS